METFYLAEGRLTNQPPALKTSSPAFLYGESVFTSFLAVDGKVKGLSLHQERIKRAAKTFWGDEAQGLWDQGLLELKEAKADLSGAYRVRFTLYRDDSLRTLWTFKKVIPEFEERKVETILWESQQPFHNFKSADYGKIFAELKMRKVDDLLKVSESGEVFELSTSNLLIFTEGKFLTPPFSSNVLEGCQLGFFKSLQEFELLECKLTREDLFKADFVLGANAVKEFFVISQVDEKPLTYSKEQLESFWNHYQELSLKNVTELC